MSNVQTFYRALSAMASRKQDPYWETLAAITKASRLQLRALASELAWQTWGAPAQSA
ncbi:MAG: hypothetical protein ACOYYU_18800 [Chloroflexota bacterium]